MSISQYVTVCIFGNHMESKLHTDGMLHNTVLYNIRKTVRSGSAEKNDPQAHITKKKEGSSQGGLSQERFPY